MKFPKNIPKGNNNKREQNKEDATLSNICIHLFEMRFDKNEMLTV